MVWGKNLNGKGSERENCWLVGGVARRLGWPERGKGGCKVGVTEGARGWILWKGLEWPRGGLSRALKGGGKEKSDTGYISLLIICRWTHVRSEMKPEWYRGFQHE